MTVSFDEMELERAARSAASSTAFTLDTNERLRLGEFRAHGVEPPEIGGVPTRSSFHLLVSLGWTIEEAMGQRWMVAPAPQSPRKQRSDYDGNT